MVVGQVVAAGDREGERERAADAFVGFDPDPAAVLLDDVPGDRQAETRPAGLAADAGSVDLVEALEDPRLGGPRDADPVVGDGDDDLVAGRIGRSPGRRHRPG